MKKKQESVVRKVSNGVKDRRVEHIDLADLSLDYENPRFGAESGRTISQNNILEKIVTEFGVDDVLSSIAVNGYFSPEPIIGVREHGKKTIRIKEGNRRLAACLILAGDARAKGQEKRTGEYQEIQKKSGRKPFNQIPVIVYDAEEDSRDLLSYLGVRHIAASQPWDSFAKAAWVARIISEQKLKLEDVSLMIGDQNRTVARILEGYYFVNQLVETGRFSPKDSMRKGRGSNPDYPFSWVYTVLGYKPVRNWLELDDLAGGTKPEPVEASKLDDAADLLSLMFGNSTKGRPAVIDDSRELQDLAVALGEPARREWLKRGKKISEIKDLMKPAYERVTSGLFAAQQSLESVLPPISKKEITATEAVKLMEPSEGIVNLSNAVKHAIGSIIVGSKG
jgi:hypothetical protein